MAAGLPEGRVLAATVLVNLGLASVVGAWASLVWLRSPESPWGRDAQRRSFAVLRASVVATIACDVALLWMQAASMAEVPLLDALAILPTVVWSTYAGHAWAAGALALIAARLAVGKATVQPNSVRLACAVVAVSAFVYSRAAVSHAAQQGLTNVAMLVDCLHLWAISLWCGVVGMAAFDVLVSRREATSDEATARWIRHLSASATVALVTIAGTGLFKAWHALGSSAQLMHSAYGNALLVKLGLVSIAVGLGAFNRTRLMPELLAALPAQPGRALQPQQRFVSVLRTEAIALLATLVAAAFLSASPSPGDIRP